MPLCDSHKILYNVPFWLNQTAFCSLCTSNILFALLNFNRMRILFFFFFHFQALTQKPLSHATSFDPLQIESFILLWLLPLFTLYYFYLCIYLISFIDYTTVWGPGRLRTYSSIFYSALHWIIGVQQKPGEW